MTIFMHSFTLIAVKKRKFYCVMISSFSQSENKLVTHCVSNTVAETFGRIQREEMHFPSLS